MYANASIATGSTAALAFTGMESMWALSAGFTLIFAGLALRTIFKRKKAKN